MATQRKPHSCGCGCAAEVERILSLFEVLVNAIQNDDRPSCRPGFGDPVSAKTQARKRRMEAIGMRVVR